MANNAAPARRAVLGLDVGKASHWACILTRDGEVAVNRPVANSEHELDRLFSQVGEGTLVVVDQARNIGALPISRARRAGLDVACLPGIAAHQASRMFAGDAKTDERDAHVIARTAMGLPDAPLPVPERDGNLEAARSLASQCDHMMTCATRDKNRLRSILLESCPAFEALVDPSDPRWLRVHARLGGAWGVADAGRASLSALMQDAGGPARADAWTAIASSTRPPEAMVRAENPQVKMLARHISEAMEEASRLDAEIASLLESDDTYACLLTIPGIGPRTASELTIAINISSFPDHDHLASYCGIAPRTRRSGTSIASVAASRQGNKRLKNLLIFSCNSLTKSANRFGELLPRVQGPRDVPRRGAEGGREEEAEGDLRGHAGQGPLRGLAPQKWKRAAAPMGWRQHGENLGRSTEKTVDKTIGTSPDQIKAVCDAYFKGDLAQEAI